MTPFYRDDYFVWERLTFGAVLAFGAVAAILFLKD